MTGFGCAEHIDESYNVRVDIKSVNSRFLEIDTRLPFGLMYLEPVLKKLIKKSIFRGKVSLFLSLKEDGGRNIRLNEPLFNSFLKIYNRASSISGLSFNLNSILSKAEIIDQVKDKSSIDNTILDVFGRALSSHAESAQKEGESMVKFFTSSLLLIKSSLDKIENFFPVYKTKRYQEIKERVEELTNKKIENEEKILVELAIQLSKADITEEIERLNHHLTRFKSFLALKNTGKNINFILQEMHREINTIGSKFGIKESFDDIILIKQEIEKCREVVQNVE